MGAIVAWTLNVETNPLNLLCTNINWDEVESLKNILFHSTTVIETLDTMVLLVTKGYFFSICGRCDL